MFNREWCSSALLPDGKLAGGKGALDIDEALVAGAAEAEADVAFGLNKGSLDEDVKFTDHIEQDGVGHDFLPCVARVAPDVVTQFRLDAVDEGAGAFGLLQGITAREGDWRLVVGDDLHQLVECALFPTLEIP